LSIVVTLRQPLNSRGECLSGSLVPLITGKSRCRRIGFGSSGIAESPTGDSNSKAADTLAYIFR